MKLINTTNSHARLVQSQLESTDATLVETFPPEIQTSSLRKPLFIMKF